MSKDTEKTPEQLFELLQPIFEAGQVDINDGLYDGDPFIIVGSWSDLEYITAFLNGFEGLVGHRPYLKDGETLHDRLIEAEQKCKDDPNHWGYKREKETALSHFLYEQYLITNGIEDPVTIDDFGVEVGFNDEYDVCCCGSNGCRNIVRTSPDSYSWTAPLFIDCEGYVCEDCIETGEYDSYILDEYSNQAKSIPDSFDLDRLGLEKINDQSFENGWYGGQCDEPQPIIDAFNAKGIDVWFKVYPRQFDLDFDVYVKAADLDRAKDIISGVNTQAKDDPADVLKRGLEAATLASSELKGEGITYVKVTGDKAEARKVSPEEFIDGIKD